MDLFDTHAHLNDENYNEDRDEMIQRARQAGIRHIVNIGFNLASSRESIKLADSYDLIYAAVGIHPHDAAEAGPGYLEELEKMALHPKVAAIGEIGLDYYRDLSPRPVQRKVFVEQMALAKKLQKPIIIHDRDAHGDMMDILRKEKLGPSGGVMHCYSGSWEMARELLDMGFYISIAGPVTFSNAARLKDVAARVPRDRLLIETDAPYLTPAPYRGRRNEPAHIQYTAEEIARLRGMEKEDLAKMCAENGRKLFRIA
ncbi:TatD family hydrolase [Pelotomaculum propionicicum]|uniref:TatD family hydrolase n=1 Tax=Pelotomaculum propionicicum TaxID=258475 RepID=UPI003B794420